MSLSLRIFTISLLAVSLLLAALSCSDQQTTTVDPPVYFSEDQIDSVRTHINRGYEYLEGGFKDSAVAEFAKISDLVSTGIVAEYHTACAYNRSGDKDMALASLTTLVKNGYDSPGNLKNDPDLASLKDDPRFDEIITTAQSNSDVAIAAVVAGGIPNYDKAPQTFASVEEYEEWYSSQNKLLRSHGTVWTSAVQTAAKLDLIARSLAVQRELKVDDPEFDYGLERVKSAATISSMYETWGAVTDIVLNEVTNYMKDSPSKAGTDEANYRAGLALSMQYGADNDQRIAAYTKANSYLDKISEESEFYGTAQTIAIVNQMRLPNADREALKPEFKRVVKEYSDDRNAYRIISTQVTNEAVQMLWPIEIGIKDIDGKMVNLDQYKGKVLLIDFWATWCPPCREELPNLLATYKEYNPKGFEIVSISLDYTNRVPLPDYRDWISEKGMNWRHTYDGEGWNTGLIKEYFVSGIPAPFLVGTDGSLVAWGEECYGEKLVESVKSALKL